MQIIQHSGPLPGSEDGGEQKPLLWKAQDRVSDDVTMLRSSKHSRNSRNKPQRMERNNVESIRTLQLSHPNVIQTFKAATRPLQVCSICLSANLSIWLCHISDDNSIRYVKSVCLPEV